MFQVHVLATATRVGEVRHLKKKKLKLKTFEFLAHGKRNGLNIPQQLPQNRGGEIPDSRWFMSRLVQAPLEERFDRNMETPPNHDRSFEPQFFSDAQSELDPLKMCEF